VIVPLQFETEFAQDREDCGKAAKGFPVGVAPGGGGDGRMGDPPFRVYGEQSPERRAVHDSQIGPVPNVMGKVVHIDGFCIQWGGPSRK